MAEDDLPQETVLQENSVQRELVLPAPVNEVWKIVTGDGWLAEEVVLELQPGGDARFTGPHPTRNGWVEEAQAPEGGEEAARLIFWWENDRESGSRVELILEPADGGTRLRVTEARPLEVLDARGISLPGSGGGYGPAMLAVA